MKHEERIRLNQALDKILFSGSHALRIFLEGDRFRLHGGGLAYLHIHEEGPDSGLSLKLITDTIAADRNSHGGDVLAVSSISDNIQPQIMLGHMEFFEKTPSMTHASFLTKGAASGLSFSLIDLPTNYEKEDKQHFYYLSKTNGLYPAHYNDMGDGLTFNPHATLDAMKPILTALSNSNHHDLLYCLNAAQLVYGEVHEKEAAYEWLLDADNPSTNLHPYSTLEQMPAAIAGSLNNGEINYEEAADSAITIDKVETVSSLISLIDGEVEKHQAAFAAALTKHASHQSSARPKARI